MEKTIRALSWKQPFATAMLYGKIETRTWSTNYRGPVLICTSKQPYDSKALLDITGDQFNNLIKHMDSNTGTLDLLGYAIAIADLVDCRPMKKEDEKTCFVAYHSDLYCHVYENVKQIEPFKWKGTQGWKTLSEAEAQMIIIKN